MIGLLTIPIAVSAQQVQWKPINERVYQEIYQLPKGWESVVPEDKTLVMFNYGTLQGDPATEQNALAFEKLTGIKIKFIELESSDMVPRVTAAMMAEQVEPDIIQAAGEEMASYTMRGWLADITGLWDESMYQHSPRGFWESSLIKGKLYGVPHVTRVMVMHYRPSILKAAGVEPPKTWDELVEVAKKLTKPPNQYGWAFTAKDQLTTTKYMLSFLYARKGRTFIDGKPS